MDANSASTASTTTSSASEAEFLALAKKAQVALKNFITVTEMEDNDDYIRPAMNRLVKQMVRLIASHFWSSA